ncbi:hypothetical protein HK104_008617 [Borealophlyctis nickersoniae]|nr:hypothetical protein HK104_008617 [Borealophlyctis nickersoniae]
MTVSNDFDNVKDQLADGIDTVEDHKEGQPVGTKRKADDDDKASDSEAKRIKADSTSESKPSEIKEEDNQVSNGVDNIKDRVTSTVVKDIPQLGQEVPPAGQVNVKQPETTHTVNYFGVAHQDDWELFMNPRAFNEVHIHGTKNVFVYTTTGDGGQIRTGFWQARESGAIRAQRFIVDSSDSWTEENAAPTNDGYWSTRVLNGHEIARYEYENTVAYFFRLPDGNLHGEGFESAGSVSLKKFQAGKVKSMTTVPDCPNPTTYTSWSDLVATIAALIREENKGIPSATVHIHEPEEEGNGGDHADHLATAMIWNDAVEGNEDLKFVHREYYYGYISQKNEQNIFDRDDLAKKIGTFAVYNTGLTEHHFQSDFSGSADEGDLHHNSWLFRHYKGAPKPGVGTCAF